MARSYSPRDLVPLPRVSAPQAFTLSSRLHQARLDEAVTSGDIAERGERMLASRETLRLAIVAQRAGDGRDPRAALEADRALDDAWSASRDWLGAVVKIGGHLPRASEVRELHSFLFGSGLSFLNTKYDVQWAESETRIDALRSERNASLVRELGGQAIVDALFAAHEAYGRALGVTRTPVDPGDVRVRGPLDDVLDRVREYVIAVVASVRHDQPETQARADRLLRPLVEWDSRPRAGGRSGDEPAEPGDPSEPSEPTPAG